MPNLRIRPQGALGQIHQVTPQSAGWTYVGFEFYRLKAGERLGAWTGDREVCLVLVSGKALVEAGNSDFGEIGGRMSPFEGAPHAVYAPAGVDWAVEATTALELAVCSAPGVPELYPARRIGPEAHPQFSRGKGSNTRLVTNILPETDPAHALLVVEVITPAGHASSYPPHKHDRDDLPNESLLEETYYHRLQPSQGFAFQRVYTDDRRLDEAMVVEDGDVVLVPRGYHPVATVHGYDSYYLNVMAGPKRVWKFHDDPQHAWMLKG
jgi:5-deoxy-glucuronate isomerase